MMKMRTRNAPARIASGTTSHHEIARLRYIRYQSAAYGTRVFVICQSARGVEGCWNLATICLHAAGSFFPWFSLELSMQSRLLSHHESTLRNNLNCAMDSGVGSSPHSPIDETVGH